MKMVLFIKVSKSKEQKKKSSYLLNKEFLSILLDFKIILSMNI